MNPEDSRRKTGHAVIKKSVIGAGDFWPLELKGFCFQVDWPEFYPKG
jgi:hypothetical protein